MILHPQYGLNPTMPVCIFCGKDKGEIALLGAAYKEEAPPKMVLDDNPCESCVNEWRQGIAFIEHNGKRATGRMSLITEEATRRMINNEALLESVLKHRKALLDHKTFDAVFNAPKQESK